MGEGAKNAIPLHGRYHGGGHCTRKKREQLARVVPVILYMLQITPQAAWISIC